MEYKILRAYDNSLDVALHELTEYVNDNMDDGWVPVGGVEIIKPGYNFNVAQAMVKQ